MRTGTSDFTQLPREASFARTQSDRQTASNIPNLSQPLIWRRAVVTYNNQNSVLLKLDIDEKRFCFLHDNRLFRFSLDGNNIQPRQTTTLELATGTQRPTSWPFYAEADEDPEIDIRPARPRSFDFTSQRNARNPVSGGCLGTTAGDSVPPSPEDLAMAILLRFQTSPKYRLLNSLYFAFRLMDNLLLLTIVVQTVLQHKLELPTFGQRAIYSAVGLELFYDVMLYTTKYWFLERLSIYVGIGLYLMYFTLVTIFHAETYVWIVLGLRLAAFIIEEGLDVGIDIEMHNDLMFVCDTRIRDIDALPYTDVRRALLDFPYLPTSGFFTGSGSAWLPQSAFAEETYSRSRFKPYTFRWLYIIPFLVCIPCILVLTIFVSVPLIMFLLVDRIWHVRGSRLWDELTAHY